MAIDPNAIKKQLRRLTGLNFPPTEQEGWNELAKVLQRRCSSIQQVERVIDRWIETEENVPKPSQLGALCTDVEASEHPILPAPCPQCEADGLWRTVERLGSDGQIVSCLARCTCARGRQLAAMNAKEEAGRNRKQPTPFRRIVDTPREEIG